MKRRVLSTVLLGALTSYSQLTVNIKNVESSNGNIMVAVFNTESSFPKQQETYRNEVVAATKGITTITLKNLPKGKYALAIYHDENQNQKMDKNLVGAPKEAYGFSNDARATFSAPSFKLAAFNYRGSKEIEISIK